jgi:hypothetical protein
MQKITSIGGLRNAIHLLKVEQVVKEQKLKEQFYLTCESLKPVNLIGNTLKNIVQSPYLIDNIVGIGIGLATGYLSKKLVSGVSRSLVRKLFGTIIQVGATRLITQRPHDITSSRQPIFKNIFRKKEFNSKKP